MGGLGVILRASDALTGPAPGGSNQSFGVLFLPWLTATGFWATLSLSIPDFTRYAASQTDQVVGRRSLLTTMPLFAFIGVAVTSATVLLYGTAIWNPVELVGRLAAERGSPVLGLLALAAILVATLTTNIAANIVAPANSFSNLSPRRVSARAGGLIAALIGIAILPWKLLDAYQTWLISYSGCWSRRRSTYVRLRGRAPGRAAIAGPVRCGRCLPVPRGEPPRHGGGGRRHPGAPGRTCRHPARISVQRRLVLGNAGVGAVYYVLMRPAGIRAAYAVTEE